MILVSKRVAGLVILLSTVLWGAGYAIEGGYLLLVFADILLGQANDLSARIPIALLGLVGGLFLFVEALAMLAALGLLWGRPWGRFLLFITAMLAVSLGLVSLDPPEPLDPDISNVPLGAAQVLYGLLALAVLGLSRPKPKGITILALMAVFVGLPAALYGFEAVIAVIHGDPYGGARKDPADLFATLGAFSGFVAGLLLTASGTCLFASGWKRFVTVIALIIAAACAQAAQAIFALLGALMGHTREGLLEGYLLFFGFPVAIVLLVLIASGIWYLTRPHVRRSLEAE